jgi:hypothetical protein
MCRDKKKMGSALRIKALAFLFWYFVMWTSNIQAIFWLKCININCNYNNLSYDMVVPDFGGKHAAIDMNFYQKMIKPV